LLSAQVPHPITKTDGQTIPGSIEVVLCPSCDLDDAVAAPLIRFFDSHPEVTEDSTGELAGLLRAWVNHLQDRTMDAAQLDREYEQWRLGEL
jgi:hypothetical protein